MTAIDRLVEVGVLMPELAGRESDQAVEDRLAALRLELESG